MEDTDLLNAKKLPLSVIVYVLVSFFGLSLVLLWALAAYRIDRTYTGSILPSQVGSVVGSSRTAVQPHDASGFLSFGPYLKVASGEYEVSITYSSDHPTNTLDFFINQDKLELGKVTLEPGVKVTANLFFSVPPSSDGHLLESRVFFGGEGSLTLDSIRIQQSSSWLSLFLNNKKAFLGEFVLALFLAAAFWYSHRSKPAELQGDQRGGSPTREVRALFWYFGAAAVIGLALQFFTGFHSHQHSDSLLLSIGGFQLPTLFYWGQNQYFWAVPMVLSVFPNQELQLILQVLVYFLMLAAIPVFLAWILRRPSSVRFSLFFLLVLAAFSAMFFFELSYQAYVPALFFALLSLVLMEKAQRDGSGTFPWLLKLFLAGLTLALAYLTAEPSILVWLVFFVFLFLRSAHLRVSNSTLTVEGYDARGTVLPGILLVLIAGQILFCIQSITVRYLAFFGITPRKMAFNLDPLAVEKALNALQDNVYAQFLGSPWVVVLLIALGVVGLFFLVRSRSKHSWATYFLVFVLPGVALWLVMACLDWVAQNAYSGRYTIFSLFLFVGALAFALDQVSLTRLERPFLQGLALAVCMVVVVRLGLLFGPMPFHSPASLVKGSENLTELSRVDGVIGGYWDVWPLVWKLDVAYGKPYKGITFRGDQVIQTARSRNSLPEVLTLVAVGKSNAIESASAQHLPDYRQLSAIPHEEFTLLTLSRVAQ